LLAFIFDNSEQMIKRYVQTEKNTDGNFKYDFGKNMVDLPASSRDKFSLTIKGSNGIFSLETMI